ncbi:T9SS type A sorting domain-containing protein [candidate division KSB1 bacterium]|nr:T9SS type A sorting domain-containing protein [candidate division KSB1 bacterium]
MKYSILICSILLVFTSIFAAEYTVPRAAYSVYAEDLDLDGDKDIVVGHNYNSQTEWGGVSILQNNGEGEFTLIDSIFLFAWQPDIQIKNLNLNEFPEIIAKHYNSEEENEYIAIINNFNLGDISHFSLNTNEGVGIISSGDIDNDNDIDIVVASHSGQFWGVMGNDGTGQFSSPEYYYVDYYPGGIACGDLNNDGRDDIVVCGLKLEVYLSYTYGFEYILVDETNYQNELKIADIDNDGDNDLIVSRYGAPHLQHFLQIYENDDSCNFTLEYEVQVLGGIFDLQIVEINNDGYLDIIYTKDVPDLDQVFLRMNNADGTFSEEISYCANLYCIGCFSADLDDNGWNDIITIHYIHSYLPGNLHILFNDGTGNFVEEPPTGIIENEGRVINGFTLYQNYPNPFNPTTIIKYRLPEESKVTMRIFNILGREIATLVDEHRDTGYHIVNWNANGFASGVYLLRIEAQSLSQTTEKRFLKVMKMVLAK